jgi:serine/threonine protein phosphatase PrpC
MQFPTSKTLLILFVCLNSFLTLSMEAPLCEVPMEYGIVACQGKRPTMEDAHAIVVPFLENDPSSAFFAIYDGHGGKKVAEYCTKVLHQQVSNAFLAVGNMKEALTKGFEETDKKLAQSELKKIAKTSGSTAVVAVIKDNMLYIAHVGDSRAILARDSKALLLTQDHTPDRLEERTRIEKAGGIITEKVYIEKEGCFVQIGVTRVGGLAVSRAIGDHALRDQGVIATPTVIAISLTPEDEFVILACDGVFERNIITIDGAASIVRQALETYKDSANSCQKAAQALVTTALHENSTDNVSALIINLQREQIMNRRKKESELPIESSDEDLPSTQEVSFDSSDEELK